ncbi:hypothetical protein D3C77_717090 [compost metagenome]
MNRLSASAQLFTWMRPSPSIAWAALVKRLSSTWLICEGAQAMRGSSPSDWSTSALSLMWLRAISRALRMQSLRSTSSLMARSRRAKSLSPETSSAIWPRP